MMLTSIKKMFKNLAPYIRQVIVVLAVVLLAGGGIAYAQFARQTGDVGWGYGYGYGYGIGYGWDAGLTAGHRNNTEDEWTSHYGPTGSDIPFDNVLFVAENSNSNDVYISDNGSEGIAHYDGTTWTQYTTSNSDISGNAIRVFLVDGNGVVWMTDTMNGGLVSFDPNEDDWTRYTTLDGLPTNLLASATVDSDNNIWISTFMYGLIMFDGVTFTNYTTLDGLESDALLSVAVDTSDNVWVTYMGSVGVSKFDGDTWTTYTTADGLYSDSAQLVDAGLDDTVWFSHTGAVSKFDGDTWTTYDSDDYATFTTNSIGDIFTDNFGNLWLKFIPTTNGIIKFDGDTWTNYTTGNSEMPNDYVYRMSAVNDRIWFSTSSGSGAVELEIGVPGEQYGYGYGYGYMIGHADDDQEISWDAGSQRYEIDADNLPGYLFFDAGIVVPDGLETSSSEVIFDFAVDISAGNNFIEIEEGTTMTTDAVVTDFTQFSYEDLEEGDVTLPDGQDFVLAFSFGLPDTSLSVDPAISITAAPGDDYNGDELNIYHMSPEEDEWTLIATCTVSVGDCLFETTRLSSFLISTDEESEDNDGGPNDTSKKDPWQDEECVATSYRYNHVLREGSSGSEVRNLQETLIAYGLLSGSADGDFGPGTKRAVQALQREAGLPDDGVVGPATGDAAEIAARCGDVSDYEADEEIPRDDYEVRDGNQNNGDSSNDGGTSVDEKDESGIGKIIKSIFGDTDDGEDADGEGSSPLIKVLWWLLGITLLIIIIVWLRRRL